MEEDDFGGDIGGKGRDKGKKILNPYKQEQKRRAENPPDPVIEEDFDEPEREFGDGSRLTFDLTREHMDLLGRIVDQKDDDCWARVLRMILSFNFNKDEVVANRKPLSMDGLIKHILGGKEHVSNLAVPSLSRAIQFIKDVGLEKDFGRNQGTSIFTVKGKFRTEPNANSDRIRNLLQVKGPIGIYVHLQPEFSTIGNGIYHLKVPTDEIMAEFDRHVLILVACGETVEGKIFFLAQNTWGKIWGVNGYGRILVEETCPIVYLESLL